MERGFHCIFVGPPAQSCDAPELWEFLFRAREQTSFHFNGVFPEVGFLDTEERNTVPSL